MKAVLLILLLVGVAETKKPKEKPVEHKPGMNLVREYPFHCNSRHQMYVDMNCVRMFEEMLDEIKDTADTMTTEIAKRHQAKCESMEYCFQPMSCSTQRGMKKASKTLKIYCDLYSYRLSDFSECGAKLAAAGSTCYEHWNPYPKELLTEKNLIKRATMVVKACEEYFGADNCLEKDVTEACGEKQWIELRDHLIELNTAMNNCSLSDNAIVSSIPTTTEKPYYIDMGDPYRDV